MVTSLLNLAIIPFKESRLLIPIAGLLSASLSFRIVWKLIRL